MSTTRTHKIRILIIATFALVLSLSISTLQATGTATRGGTAVPEGGRVSTMHTLVKFALLAQPVSTAGGLPTPSLSPSTYRHWRYLVWRHSLYERWMANRLNRLAASNNRLVVSTPTLPVPAWVMADAMRVHVCEEPSWFVHGYRSSGGLGWMNATWDQFKAPSFPANMGDATIEQQAWAMWRFANTYGWPDQSGYCHGY